METLLTFSVVIQGTADADVGGKLTQDRVAKAVNFGLNAFQETSSEERQRVLEKVATINGTSPAIPDDKANLEKLTEQLTEDELKILNHIRAKQMLRFEDIINIDHFGSDAIDGLTPNLKRGNLTLVPQGKDTLSNLEVEVPIDYFEQEEERVAKAEHKPMSAEAERNPVSAAA